MTKLKTLAVVAGLALLGAPACADLEVTNLNDPDANRAIASAGDVESLVAGGFNTWFNGMYNYNGPGLFMSNASFQHTAPWANFGMEFYGRIPRVGVVNDPADQFYGSFTRPWYFNYRALAGVADGLRALANNPDVAAELGAADAARMEAFGKFVQGMAHASIAVLYDQGFVVDETTDLTQAQTALDYNGLMAAALGYFDAAIALAQANTFTIPRQWMSIDVPSSMLAQLASSQKARFRAAVARNPAERANVDWNAVITEANAGITTDFVMDMDPSRGWYNQVIDFSSYPGWAENPYFVIGMADQGGNYQRWLDLPNADRVPTPAGQDPIIIETPDTRFPQGSTVGAQEDNPGTQFVIPSVDGYAGWAIGNVWARPDRGTWRWSYYWHISTEQYTYFNDFDWPEFRTVEIDLLKAEAEYRNGNMGAAADLVNPTRTAAGLSATDASGTNTDCVPRLPDSSCGDLLEMIKWEKRMENRMTGLLSAPQWFDSRGWGDLYLNTPLQFPAPCRELQVLDMLPCYTFGGPGGDFSSPGSSYAYPDES